MFAPSTQMGCILQDRAVVAANSCYVSGTLVSKSKSTRQVAMRQEVALLKQPMITGEIETCRVRV